MSRDNALQLLLIVDYIFDWARDVYRPSLLRQLKSLITGEDYDQVSLAPDSDIFSTRRRNVSDWIPPPPSTIGGPESGPDVEADSTASREVHEYKSFDLTVDLDHESILGITIPNTELGTIRSASIIQSRLMGFYGLLWHGRDCKVFTATCRGVKSEHD